MYYLALHAIGICLFCLGWRPIGARHWARSSVKLSDYPASHLGTWDIRVITAVQQTIQEAECMCFPEAAHPKVPEIHLERISIRQRILMPRDRVVLQEHGKILWNPIRWFYKAGRGVFSSKTRTIFFTPEGHANPAVAYEEFAHSFLRGSVPIGCHAAIYNGFLLAVARGLLSASSDVIQQVEHKIATLERMACRQKHFGYIQHRSLCRCKGILRPRQIRRTLEN